MPIDRSRIYEDGPLPALLRHEQAMLSSILDGVFGVWGLHLRPHRDRNFVALDPSKRYSVNQDAVVQLLAWAGNLTVSGAQFQGVMADA